MIKKKSVTRERAKTKIRKKISGTSEKPRLSVFRSLDNVYAQLIDDVEGKTILSVSSLSKELADDLKSAKNKVEKSKLVGIYLAKKAIENKISAVVFDRNGFRYHGRVKAVADGAREGGLKF